MTDVSGETPLTLGAEARFEFVANSEGLVLGLKPLPDSIAARRVVSDAPVPGRKPRPDAIAPLRGFPIGFKRNSLFIWGHEHHLVQCVFDANDLSSTSIVTLGRDRDGWVYLNRNGQRAMLVASPSVAGREPLVPFATLVEVKIEVGAAQAPAASTASGTGINELPDDVLALIFQHVLGAVREKREDIARPASPTPFGAAPDPRVGTLNAHLGTQLLALRSVCKRWNAAAANSDAALHRQLAEARFEMVPHSAKVRDWAQYYTRRVALVYKEELFVSECEFEFKCPLMFEQLKPVDAHTAHCHVCDSDVHVATTIEEYEEHRAQNHCISFRPPRTPGSLMPPPVPPPMMGAPALPPWMLNQLQPPPPPPSSSVKTKRSTRRR